MPPQRLIQPTSDFQRRPPSLTLVATLLLLLCQLLLSSPLLHAQRSAVAARTVSASTAEVADAGPLPVSEPMEITLRLAQTDEQIAALQALLAEQTTPASAVYHHWLTPAQFGQQFGASDEQIAAITAWAEAQGLSVSSVSPARTRLVLTGTAGQIGAAFSTDLHRLSLSGQSHFGAMTQPSLPAELSGLVSSVSGLDDLPKPRPTTVSSLTGKSLLSDPLAAAASLIDSNTSAVLTISSASCSSDLTAFEVAAYRNLFRQANAQGITIVATSSCGTRGTSSFPASLAEVTAVATEPADIAATGIDPRPGWQSAPGLPPDGMRQQPDLLTSSAGAFTEAVSEILTKSNARQGNLNRNLYALAPLPGLFTQPDATSTTEAGSWEPHTGLGSVDLKALVKAYASGVSSTNTSLISTSYNTTYGQQITLTSTVTATSYGATAPSGTVTFTSPTLGTIGSSSVNNGVATLTTAMLPVGSDNITATYSGDSSYVFSSSSSIGVYVTIGNATITAIVSPTNNVPFGATATVTATVNLPNSTIAPSGNVTAQFESSGVTFSNTLSPNTGSNTATTNIAMSVPPPGTYTISVTCLGSTNFQCQSPALIRSFTSIKGNSNVTISVSPAAPQAGQPIQLTATVGNAGNGTGTYTFSGSVSFYDNGKLIATAAVATNQATTTKTLSGNTTHNIVATYTGDANWNPSGSTAAAVTPTILASSLILSSNVGNAASTLAGVNIVFTGSVTTNVANTAGPTGTVTFYDTFNGGVVQLGSPSVLVPNGPTEGIALLSTTGLPAGTHSVYGVYSGDSNFAPATSPVLALTVADYGLTMVPSALTLTGGTSGNVTMLLNISGGFAGSVSFGCTPPAGSEATCSFSPASLSSGGVTTMTINTTAASSGTSTSQARPTARRPGAWQVGTTLTLASLFVIVVPRRKRSFTRSLSGSVLPFLMACVLLGAAGCGAGTTNTPVSTAPTGTGNLGTPLGTMNFQVTAAGTNGINTSRHTYQYQVTVQ